MPGPRSSEDVAALRQLHQGLSGAPLTSPSHVVAHLGAVQAQEFGPATWSLGQRSASPSRDQVRAEFDAGSFVRTHALRPTWHFLHAADLRWIQALTAPRVRIQTRYYERQAGVDDDLAARASAVFASALRGGNALTRGELGAALAAAGIEASGNRLAYLTMRSELDATLVSGPMRGKQHTYALADERVPAGPVLSGDEALHELTRRYFTGHGPATAKDFAWWSSLTLAQVRRGLELVGDELSSETVEGLTFHWAAGGHAGSQERAGVDGTVHLLQTYDELLVAYAESRHAAYTPAGRSGSEARGGLAPSVMLAGRVVGRWHATCAAGRLEVRVTPAGAWTDERRSAAQAAVARYAAFTGRPDAGLEWVPVTT